MGEPTHIALLAKRFAMTFMVLLVAAGCDAHLSDANLREVRPDMTTKEVESILGQPKKVDIQPESSEVKTLPVTRYVYEQNGRQVVLKFVGDRLATGGVEGAFEASSPAPSPKASSQP